MHKEIATQIQETQSPKQDKSKAKHPMTHMNKSNEDQTHEQTLKAAREKQK